MYKRAFSATVHTQRTAQVAPLSVKSYHFLSETEAAAIPALPEDPKTLWAQGKHDVGLIKNAEPVVITPKSDYRPYHKQYPLKHEAIDGITPEFESLRNAGVIVPCEISPVRSPIFPKKKADKNKWRFVQYLRAVNAAVQDCQTHIPFCLKFQLMHVGFQLLTWRMPLSAFLFILIASTGSVSSLKVTIIRSLVCVRANVKHQLSSMKHLGRVFNHYSFPRAPPFCSM